jgi:putative endonuclease
MTTFATGRLAEKAAADYLRGQGFQIIEQNWRTKWAEIDIVATYKGAAYCCEVKYRESARQGGGLDYITPGKLRQMARAADSWVQYNDWPGEYQLASWIFRISGRPHL